MMLPPVAGSSGSRYLDGVREPSYSAHVPLYPLNGDVSNCSLVDRKEKSSSYQTANMKVSGGSDGETHDRHR